MSLPEDESPPVSPLLKLWYLLTSPTRIFREIRDEPLMGAVVWYTSFLFLALGLTGIITLFHYDYLQATYPWEFYLPVFEYLEQTLSPLFLLFSVVILLFGLILHLFVYIAGGRKGIDRTFTILLYACTPVLLTIWAFEVSLLYHWVVAPFIFLIGFFWTIILMIIGIRECNEFSTGRAILPFGLIILIFSIIAFIITISTVNTTCDECNIRHVEVTAECTDHGIRIIHKGGSDADHLVNLKIWTDNASDTRTLGDPTGILSVGSSLIWNDTSSKKSRVVALALFNDGKQAIVLDETMNCNG